MRLNHVVLKRVVVVSLVEKRVYPSRVNLEFPMVYYVAWNRDWKRRFYFLAVSRKEKLVQNLVGKFCPQCSIKQVSLEVNDYVVLILNQVCVIVKVQYEL